MADLPSPQAMWDAATTHTADPARGVDIFNPDTYANGDPSTFGLPLDEFDRLRDESPCHLQEFDHPLFIDRAWIVTRNEDIAAIDRDAETFAADLAPPNVWKIAPVAPKHMCADLSFAQPA